MLDNKMKEVALVLSAYRTEMFNLQEALEKIDKIYNPKPEGKEIWSEIKKHGRFNPKVR